jgi:[ribosomal protein S18]-alanine N-acetyltransferase
MTVELRPMRWWDIESVMGMEVELFAEDAWSDAMYWSELAERESRFYLVAVDDDDVVGYAGLCAYAADVAYVQTIGVTEKRQGEGIGAALLDALLGESDRRGTAHVDLEVRDGNEAAIHLYEKHGFGVLGRRRGYYQPSGADALVMRRSRPRQGQP